MGGCKAQSGDAATSQAHSVLQGEPRALRPKPHDRGEPRPPAGRSPRRGREGAALTSAARPARRWHPGRGSPRWLSAPLAPPAAAPVPGAVAFIFLQDSGWKAKAKTSRGGPKPAGSGAGRQPAGARPGMRRPLWGRGASAQRGSFLPIGARPRVPGAAARGAQTSRSWCQGDVPGVCSLTREQGAVGSVEQKAK